MIDMVGTRPTLRGAWGAEIRATLSLAWPMVLTNIAGTAMTTTDIILIGRLGPDKLAAAALGTNLYFAFLIFAIGIVTATAPMIAGELGRNRFSVRDIRRTFRQGLWSAVAVAMPIWLVLWQAEALLLVLGQEPALARTAAGYMHTLQWAILPFLFYIVIRSLISALERPLSAMWIGVAAIVINAAIGYVLIFGHFGFPRLELSGRGSPRRSRRRCCSAASPSTWSSTGAFAAIISSAVSGAPTGGAFAPSGALDCRSASRSPSK